MRKLFFIAIFFGCLWSSCASDSNDFPLENELLGKWMMHKIYQKGNDITQEHNPENSRWVKFTKNGKYASGGEPYGISMGKWQFNEMDSKLQMVSKEKQVSNWEVSLKGDELIWKGIGDESLKEYKFVLKKNHWKNS